MAGRASLGALPVKDPATVTSPATDPLDQAILHHRAGNLPAAEQLYRQVLAATPERADAWNGLGVVAQQMRQHAQAVKLFERAIAINSNVAMYYSNMGVALHDLGYIAQAEASHRRALSLVGDDAAIHNNLAIVLRDLGRTKDAQHHCLEAIRLRPEYSEAHNNLGNVYKDLNDFPRAQGCYEAALRLNPNYVPSIINLGVVYREQGMPRQAVSCFNRAMTLEPNDALRIKTAIVLPVIVDSFESMQLERAALQARFETLRTERLSVDDPVVRIGMTVFYPPYQGFNDVQIQAVIGEVMLKATPSLGAIAPHCQGPRAPKPAGERLKIGFLSSYLYEHTIGKLNAGFIRHFDRSRFHVTVFRFAGHDDEVARYINEKADAVVTLSGVLALAREQVAREQLDLLFYPDLGMDPVTYFLAFARLAPVQCVTWGHPVTSGIPNIDYFISGTDLEPAGAESHYTEQLVRIDNLPTFYYWPKVEGPERTRADFGLDPEAHLYLCPQSLFKIHPEFDSILRQILRADPAGRFVLLRGQQAYWTTILDQRFQHSLGEQARQVVWVDRQGRDDFIRLLSVADVILDPIHFSGGNTSYEAFSVGVPIVTLPGGYMRSRVTYACYRKMGMLDCVAASADEYVRLAVRLGTDPAWRAEMRAKIEANRARLYEDMTAVRELEDVFARLIQGTST